MAKRTLIIKGGPGVGKSTLMKKAGVHYEEEGMEVHYYHCSGDPDSVDAVYVPANTKTIGFFAKTRRGAVYASNNRKMLFDLRKRNGYFSFDIKPSPKAQIFFIRYMGGTLRFLTIPNLLNVNYSKLIVPAKAVK